MKKIFFIGLLLSSLVGYGQGGWLKPNNSYGTISNRASIDSTLFFPTGSGAPSLRGYNLRKGAVYLDSTAFQLWVFNPSTSLWDSVHIGAAGSSGSSWLTTGNTGIDTSVNWLGTNDANDLKIVTNGVRRFTVNTNGALGIGSPADYGTAGDVLQSAGSGGAAAWVAASSIGITTASNGLTASGGNVKLGGTLTQSTTINNDTYDFTWNTGTDPSDFDITGGSSILWNSVNSGISAQVGLTSGYSVTIGTYENAVGLHNSALEIYTDSTGFSPYKGLIAIDTLINRSNQNTLVGWINGISAPNGNGHGNLGYVTISTGLSLASGALSATLTPSSTNTFTNKRWTARVGSTTSSATPTINTDNYDIYKLTAQAADITSMTTNLSGTPVDGDILEIQITGTAARAITWGSSFVSTTVTLPTTTVTTTTLTVILQYYTSSSYGNNKWHCVNYY